MEIEIEWYTARKIWARERERGRERGQGDKDKEKGNWEMSLQH